ncbi:CUB domain,Low-density lipoprotein (LDL) receptor class A repeat,Low-density lipoprotein (LDL) [Cinara cedri]|uniref:CUB domain,Low-density lipoprotein (LDL) receptor class A repeat,Low-density lipoprotein (LDL) n=1 Tax=Cinara cedri TaxID=506608 RepID=A0A5E4NN57_9HEMI|nr:CUB domain,Low-density lipoprotein (LDL) receptor class A repeat,Low-density lipoprotein (LDL) [Cinara cedri]
MGNLGSRNHTTKAKMQIRQALIVCGVLAATIDYGFGCQLSEFMCDTGYCVAMDKFCNGNDDCGDKSDEPPYCSPCNRTYHGEVGRTYELEVRRPREDRLPFLCYLNFTAAGGKYGDIIQLTFDTFTVGKFVSYTLDGCPDGYMSIRESQLPDTGGQWCGSAWGFTVYYSETRSINLTLTLSKLSEQGIGYNFDFKLSYKYLKKSDAHLRYGNSTFQTWRGQMITGSYCDRILDQCDRKLCRVQSPNFPGAYPRNVTCYYRIEQRTVPKNKRALIVVRQPNAHKIHIKDQVINYDRSQRTLRVWDQCNVIQDYLTVYDGSLATDPVLVRLCGGDAVPDIVSSGPNMLLEFHTSAFDNPFHPVPLSYLPGFELDVEVLFVDNKSPSYAKNTSQCEFFIKPFNNTNWGLLDSPRHSLPPNTSCKYHFQGIGHQTVWLSFIKYHAASTDPNAYHLSNQCNARLRIWDKIVSLKNKNKAETVLLGEFCKEQELPRLCDHALLGNDTRHVRPCTAEESYTSSANELTVEIYLKQGSVLFPLQFLLRYEFVDQTTERRQGPSDAGPAACSRSLSTGSGYFGSPKNVFFYGRGGRRNLTCVFVFTPGGPDERVRVTLSRMHATAADAFPCTTETDARTERTRCVYPAVRGDDDDDGDDGVAQARLTITHYPWPDIELPVGCACSSLRSPLVFESYPGAAVRVRFTVLNMNVTQDHRDFGFAGEYAFVQTPSAERIGCRAVRDRRRLRGPGGVIALDGGDGGNGGNNGVAAAPVAVSGGTDHCAGHPWLIEPATAGSSMLRTGGFVYLKLRGYEILPHRWRTNSFMCPTRNRVIVYTGAEDGPKSARVICPYDAEATYHALGSFEVFSPGWTEPLTGAQQLQPNSKTVVIEFLDREYGSYTITWMEVSKMPRIMPSTNVNAMSSNVHPECAYRCPELNACISSLFWCDGVPHCPMGFDEDPVNCADRNGISLVYVSVLGGTAAVLFTVTVVAAVVCLRCKACSRRAADGRRRATGSQQKTSGTGAGEVAGIDRTMHFVDKRFLDQNGGIAGGDPLGKRYPSTSDDLYLECKDSVC